jgi:hypothetical protein
MADHAKGPSFSSAAVEPTEDSSAISPEPAPVARLRPFPGVGPDGQQPARHPLEESVLDSLDEVVRQVFDVGLTLGSCVPLVPQPAAVRLNDAIRQLDTIIRNLRTVAFKNVHEFRASAGDGPGEVLSDPPPETDR